MAAFIERDERCLFVGNLDSRVTEEILWELFLQAGPLEAVHIPKDKETGRQKTFGFVSCSHEVSVPYTINLLNGISLYGRAITVKSAQPNANSPGNQSPSSVSSPLIDNQNGRSSPQLSNLGRVFNVSPVSRPGFDFRNGQSSANSNPLLFMTPPFLPRNEIMISPWQQSGGRLMPVPGRFASPQLFLPRGVRHFRPDFK